MTRPNITPGPWTSKISKGGYILQTTCYRIAEGESNMPVALLPLNHAMRDDPSISEANARAIAAVPALLEALEQLANDQEVGFIARAALTAAGYQF